MRDFSNHNFYLFISKPEGTCRGVLRSRDNPDGNSSAALQLCCCWRLSAPQIGSSALFLERFSMLQDWRAVVSGMGRDAGWGGGCGVLALFPGSLGLPGLVTGGVLL